MKRLSILTRRAEMEYPPGGFLGNSLYKENVYFGSDKVWPSGFSKDPDKEGHGEYGIYVTPLSKYARNYGDNLHVCMANFSNPLIVENKGEISPRDLTRKDIDQLKTQGYDAIVVTSSNQLGKASEFVLFDSKQLWVMGAR